MSNIDLSQIITSKEHTARAEQLRTTELRGQCRAHILAVCSDTDQMNLAASAAAGQLTRAQKTAYIALLEWIAATRATCAARLADPADTSPWPKVPAKAAKLSAAL